MDFTAYKAAYKGLPCISKSTSDSWWEKLSCTNAFKQFIPNPLNSRFLSEADDIVEAGAKKCERAGWRGSWGNAGSPSPPLWSPSLAGRGVTSSNQPFTWITQAMKARKTGCGISRLFSEPSVSTTSTSIVRRHLQMLLNNHSECPLDACHRTTKCTFTGRRRWLQSQHSQAPGIQALPHAICVYLGRHSLVHGEQFRQVKGTETKRS